MRKENISSRFQTNNLRGIITLLLAAWSEVEASLWSVILWSSIASALRHGLKSLKHMAQILNQFGFSVEIHKFLHSYWSQMSSRNSFREITVKTYWLLLFTYFKGTFDVTVLYELKTKWILSKSSTGGSKSHGLNYYGSHRWILMFPFFPFLQVLVYPSLSFLAPGCSVVLNGKLKIPDHNHRWDVTVWTL